eukprot:CAMPEP_0194733664 /NCGR_PEP_ID=MMETSP0296-20130528/66371_1 /TAXON_ID=39354 /ORGANISM="Heterosigma akashiwo, Strain CCMP2393" /LENGTH=50 /DNA_ID=CAMNT_0039642107 /DNA_START=159 /DNA_END=307 /DNA_ORIENTATION=-
MYLRHEALHAGPGVRVHPRHHLQLRTLHVDLQQVDPAHAPGLQGRPVQAA